MKQNKWTRKKSLKKIGTEVLNYIKNHKFKNKEINKRYLLSVEPGKKLRGALTLLSYKLFKDDYKKALPAAAAVEILHKSTLVHDDIGDKDKYRRGLPTFYKLFNIEEGIYSGDLVSAVAFEELKKLKKYFGNEKTLKCYELLTQFFRRVYEGQLLDAFFEKSFDLKEKDYFNMIKGKTCTALEVALKMGAVLGDGQEYNNALEEYGKYFGFAFQIQNDLNNLTGLEEELGRRRGSDIYEKKRTLLIIHALNKGEKQKKEIKKIFKKSKLDKKDVENIIAIIKNNGTKEYAEGLVKKFAEKARNSMTTLPDTKSKDIFLSLVDPKYITNEKYWKSHVKKR